MTNKKTDTFSRIVAFITAFAVAMLTVTLIHRTVISAEEAYPETADASEAANGNGESAAEEGSSEGSVSLNTENAPPTGETQEDIYEDSIVPPDNSPIENDPAFSDLNAYSDGIEPYADTNEGEISKWKTPVAANGIIKTITSKLKIYKGGKQELTPGEQVRDGDNLEFDFEWYIDDSVKDDFSKSYFEYNITELLDGVALTPRTYSYWADNRIKAVYEIKNEIDAQGKVITKMLIEPREGFEANSTNKVGSIHLEGKVKLDDFTAGNPNVTLKFFEATANVTAPSLDNSIHPEKWCVGQPEKRVDSSDNTVKYYQKYHITLKNRSDRETDGATVLDIPGSVFTGEPENVQIWYDYDPDNKISSNAVPASGGGYTFSVGKINGRTNGRDGEAYIEYEMQIDAEAAADPSIGYNDPKLKNTVTVTSNANPNESSAEAYINVSTIKPSVIKSGVVDKENNKIKWKITINSNSMGDKDFTVTDTADSNLTPNSSSWSKSDFKPLGDGVWEKEYETELPANVTNNQSFHNKAAVTYDDYPDKTYTDDCYVTYRYDDNFVNKECTGLNDDNTIGWTITVNVPEHLGSIVKSIVITDTEDDTLSQYDGSQAWRTLLKYNAKNVKIQIDGGEKQAIDENSFSITNAWYGAENGFILTIDDAELLRDIAGKTVTVSYNTKVSDEDEIGKVNLCHNKADCTVNYEKDSLSGSDSADYIGETKPEEPFILEKGLGQNSWYDESGNIDVPGKLREYISWSFTISNITNLDKTKENVITFTDIAPDGYTFDTRLEGTSFPDHYLFAEILGTYNPPFKPEVEFNNDYTVMTGKITLSPEQSADIMTNKRSIKVHYFTQMTEREQSKYLVDGEKKTFTNTVSVTSGSDTRKAEFSVDKTPDTKTVLQKSSSDKFINGTNVAYTLNVNSKAVHLGNEDAKVLTLTDTFGKYLEFNDDLTVTPSDGASWSYDENKRELRLTLKNETAYTINYTAEVVTRLNFMEYDEDDGIDDDNRDSAIIDMLYGNTATLSFPDGSSFKSHDLLSADIYRSNVYIRSQLSNKADSNEKMCLKIKKQWDDTNNPNAVGGRIDHDESVKIKLMKYYKGGTKPINSNVIALDIHKYNTDDGKYDGNDYYKIIKELPIKDTDGKEYTYKIVSEENLPENYSFEVTEMEKATGSDVISGNPYDTYVMTITNTYTDGQEKMDLTVKKDWAGENGNTENRSDSVEFAITRDGKPYKHGELNGANEWTQTFKVPKYSDEENQIESKYDVFEITKNSYYKSAVTSENDKDGKGRTFTITNTFIRREQTGITVTKVWENDDGHTDMRNSSIDFTINQDGEIFKTGKLNSANKWTQTFEVPKYSDEDNKTEYVYEVIETTNNPYYKPEVTSTNNKDGKGRTFTITNTYIPRKQTNITVQKVWKGDAGHTDLRSNSVDFYIIRDGQNYKLETLNGTNADNTTQTFIVPTYSDAAQTVPYVYDVREETKNPNYTSSVKSSENADGTKTFIITNTFAPTDITVTKHWDDDGNEVNRADGVTFTLKQNGIEYGKYTISGSKETDIWTYTIKNIPKYAKDGNRYAYTIEEKKIDGYTIAELSNPNKDNNYNASITNKYSTDIDLNEKITVTVTKHWSDEGNENNRMDVQFDLKRNGDQYGKTHTIRMSGKTGNNWDYEISDLPKYDDAGGTYSYEVVEEPVPGYTSKITQHPTEGNGYIAVISNEYEPPETIDINVTKKWEDDGYKYKRPDITLKLMQGDAEFAKHTIPAADNVGNDTWIYTFKNVPKNDNDGNAYSYTVEEEKLDGYTVSASVSGNNWLITNKYNVPHEDKPIETTPTDSTPPLTEPVDPQPGTDPTPGTDPAPGTEPVDPTPGTEPVSPTLPSVTEPPVTTTPIVGGVIIPASSSTTATEAEKTDPYGEPEDVSAKAGIFDDEFDAVRRDDIIILILTGIIITGTLILVFRHNSNNSDGKYHM